ncbi:methyltransferase family protein [Kitasatospora viridis]|uniref:Protein-S-isoprenylcysteine O-methyltransferase n=1 Tax=Kitasatospora viridis TaxID=281105 RepID=A0A561UN64_9ACTN|nr:isoprenylcysteine carboxylmethyltransferase family protein [Kitasatospora viridis]TWG00805.1 protein-S-isoprenylcysteine O-methyltransferase [Kitasatospora viridis]
MSPTSLLALIGILCWLGYELLLRRRKDAAAGTWQGDERDGSSTRLLLSAYLASTLLLVVCGHWSLGLVAPGPRYAGLVVLAGGLLLRAWGMRTLGRFYTRTLRTVQEQSVVRTGPYRLIRHPGYCGSLLVWIGYSLAEGSWVATVLVALVLGAAYGYRIHSEERLLVAALGPAYTEYSRHSKRLIPFVY